MNNFLLKRRKIFDFYRNKLSSLSDLVFLPSKDDKQLSAHHLFVIIINEKKLKISRDVLMQKLYVKGIITQVHYIPIYKHPYYKKICKGKYNGAKAYFANCLSLPIYPDLKLSELKKTINNLKKILQKNKKNG